jgi:hypothetical protein
MSDTNRVRVAYVEETSYGVTPGTPTLQILRLTKESLKQDTSTVTSQEIRSDRQTSDVIRVDVGASGDIEGELSYNAYNDFIRYAVQSSAWSSVVTVSGIAAATAATGDNSYNGTGIGVGIVANQWIKVSGYANSANNGYSKVVSRTDDKIVVKGKTLAAETGATATVVMGAQIVNGTTQKSVTIERQYADLTNILVKYLGMTIGSWDLTIQTNQIITTKFSLLGKSETSTTAEIGSVYTAATTKSIMQSVDNVLNVMDNYANLGVTNFTLALTNNLRKRSQVATLGAVSLGSGSVNITGSVNMYFTTAAMMDKYLNFTTSAISAILTDDAGNTIIVDLPSVKYTTGERMATGINGDIMANLTFGAKMDATEGIMIRVVKFDA